MTSANSQEQRPQGVNRRRILLVLLALPVFFALFMFLPAGTWAWEKGWPFILVFISAVTLASFYLWRVNPEVVVARSHSHKGSKRWDINLLGFLLPSIYAIIPVAAVDDGRFHWCPLPLWVILIGYALLLVGLGIITWAEAVNKFFEPTVRIQTERGHRVIDTGPYALVRHPGYGAGCLISVGAALSLGSLWALSPAGLACLLLILRTQWEDQTLQAELAGYKEYTERVRFRLIPGVW